MVVKPAHNFLRLLRPKPRKLSRRVPKTYAKKVKKYSAQAGVILWAWNRIHAAFAECFVEIVDPKDPNVGLAIWRAIKADTGQRDMLKESLTVRKGINPRVSKALAWLLKIVGDLSQHRNDIAHTPMTMTGALSGFVFEPDPFSGDPKKVARLSRADREAFHKALAGDLIVLSSYATVLAMVLRSPGLLGSLPRRPQLQSLPRSNPPRGSRPNKHRRPQSRP